MNKWDLYNNEFEKVNKIISEKENIPDGFYHYTLNVWFINDNNEVLLFRNSLDSKLYYPGFWNCIDINVLAGETPNNACNKCIKMVLGNLKKIKEIVIIDPKVREPYHYIYETYIVRVSDVKIDNIEFNTKYTQAKWVDKKEIDNMIDNGEISQVIVSRIKDYIYKII